MKRLLPLTLTAAAVAAGLVSLGAIDRGAGPICAPMCLDRRVSDLAAADGGLPAARTPEARALLRRQLAFSPFDDGAWLRLTAVETAAAHGRLSKPALSALEQSYRFAPVDPEAARWRTQFVFNHWREAGEGVRKSARHEMAALFSHDAAGFTDLRSSVRDPSGRLAFGLVVQQLAGTE